MSDTFHSRERYVFVCEGEGSDAVSIHVTIEDENLLGCRTVYKKRGVKICGDSYQVYI